MFFFIYCGFLKNDYVIERYLITFALKITNTYERFI
jgi:hypothetical protein